MIYNEYQNNFSITEKCDLSGDLKDQGEEDPKKARESSVTSCVANHGDVFYDA